MSEQDIIVKHVNQHVVLIQLNRQEVHNALRTALLSALADALQQASIDSNIRAVVLTGNEDAFAAGADINELAAHDENSIRSDTRIIYWQIIRDFPKPLVAAVNGYCFGGGNELAMCADIIIAGENAQFAQPEVGLGLIPGAGATQHLPRFVGKSQAMKLLLTGSRIDAATALAIGLVAEVTSVERCLSRALAIADLIAAKAPLAVQAAKHATKAAYSLPLNEGYTFEREEFATLFATNDLREGVNAFQNKRRPNFTGA